MALAAAGDRTNIRAWDFVDVYTGAVGSTLPTDVATALNAAFTAVGLMSEDELTRTRNVDITELRSMGGRLVRRKRTGQSMQFSWTALENTHKAFIVGNPGSTAATATGITTRTYKELTTLELAVVIHAVEGTNITRIVIPTAEIFADGDTTMGPSGMYSTPMTLVAYPNSTNVLFTEITNDPGASAS